MFVCLGAVAVGCVIGYVLHERIIHWFTLQAPADTLKDQNGKLYTFTPAESFLTAIWLSIYFGIVLALPVIFWQIWQFFVPGRRPVAREAASSGSCCSPGCWRSSGSCSATTSCFRPRSASC